MVVFHTNPPHPHVVISSNVQVEFYVILGRLPTPCVSTIVYGRVSHELQHNMKYFTKFFDKKIVLHHHKIFLQAPRMMRAATAALLEAANILIPRPLCID